MTIRITSTERRVDHGMARVVKELFRKCNVDVGILEPDASNRYKDGKTIAEVAIENEFGLGKPMRSWARAWLQEKHEEITSILAPVPVVVLMSERGLQDALFIASRDLIKSMTDRIRARIPPPNTPFTIAKKGSDVPLVDTEAFIDSINAKVTEQ